MSKQPKGENVVKTTKKSAKNKVSKDSVKKVSAPEIQDFQCPDTKDSSLDPSCRASKATLSSESVSRTDGRYGWSCECGMPFRAKMK